VLALVAAATIFGSAPGARASTDATLTAPSTAEVSQSVTVSWENPAPASYDWIAVFRVGAPDSDFMSLGWFYTSTCTHSTGPARTSGSCSVSPPFSASVDYEFRLFRNGGFTRIASSGSVHAVDTTAPAIKDVSASPVVTINPTAEELITWGTYEFADSQVEYGRTPSYGSSTTLDTHTGINHKQYLNGLEFNTVYHYRVKSRDKSGNLAVSPDTTFTTAGAPPGPTVTATPAAVIPGGSTTVAWDHVTSPTIGDWIGVYKAGAGDVDFAKWFYTGTCATAASTTKSVSGSCAMTMPMAPGTYELRLFANNGYTRLATSGPVTVASSGPVVSGPSAAVAAGGSTTVSWQGVASPTSMDWVGLYKSGAADTSPTKWFYTATCGPTTGTPKASGSCSLTMPAAGTYDLRLFRNGGYTRLANSRPLTVVSSLPTLTVSPATVSPGALATVAWQGVVSPAANDWIGLYKAGADDTAAVRWVYASSCTATASTTGKASGSCPLALPTAPGTYEFRLFANNGYTLLATSPAITVE
jgi:hypothetical protein